MIETYSYADLRTVVRLLGRRVWVFLIAAGLVLVAAAAYVQFSAPVYTATALLLIDPNPRDVLNPQIRNVLPNASEIARIETEVEILKSDAVLRATVLEFDLARDAQLLAGTGLLKRSKDRLGIGPKPDGTEAARLSRAMRGLKNAVVIRRQGLSYLVGVSVSLVDRQAAARLANDLAATYIDLQVRFKQQQLSATRLLLMRQLKTAEITLADAERTLANYTASNPTISPIPPEWANIGAASSAVKAKDWSEVAQILQDEPLSLLVREQERLKAQIRAVAADSPQSIRLHEMLRQVEGQFDQYASQAPALLLADADKLKRDIGGPDQDLVSISGAEKLPSAVFAHLFQLQSETAISRLHYVSLLAGLRDAEFQAKIQTAHARIVSAALPPDRASFPNVGLITILGLIFALVTGFVAAVLRDYFASGSLRA